MKGLFKVDSLLVGRNEFKMAQYHDYPTKSLDNREQICIEFHTPVITGAKYEMKFIVIDKEELLDFIIPIPPHIMERLIQ